MSEDNSIYRDSRTRVRLSRKREESTFFFNHFKNNVINVGDIGPGDDLIAINNGNRIIAVGCSIGVYVYRTFDLHLFVLAGGGNPTRANVMKFRNATPSIKITNPLQVMFNDYGDALGVRNQEGIFFYNIANSNRPIRSIQGRFKSFKISMKNHVGVLGIDGQLGIYQDMNTNNVINPFPRRTSIECFAFSPAGGRLLAGTQDGMIILFNISKNQICTRFVLPEAFRQPICSLSWPTIKFIFVSILNPMGQTPIPRACILEFTKIRNSETSSSSETSSFSLYDSHLKLFSNSVNKFNDLERKFKIQYLDHWNALLCCTNDCNQIEIFEEFDDGWFGLEWDDDRANIFREIGSFCRGFGVDFSFRIPVGNHPVSPLIIYLKENGDLSFTQITEQDEDNQTRKYDPLDNYVNNSEKDIYLNQWRRIYSAQTNQKPLFYKKEIESDLKERLQDIFKADDHRVFGYRSEEELKKNLITIKVNNFDTPFFLSLLV